MKWAHLGTIHHIKPQPLGDGLNIYLKRQKQAEQWIVMGSVRWADLAMRLIVIANSLSARLGFEGLPFKCRVVVITCVMRCISCVLQQYPEDPAEFKALTDDE